MKRTLLAASLVLPLLMLIVITWLFMTQSGLQWIAARAATWLPGTLEIGSVEGRLSGPLILNRLRYQWQGNEIEVGHLELDWEPVALFSARLRIHRLLGDEIAIDLAPITPTVEQNVPLTLPDIRLPLIVIIEELQLNQLQLSREKQELLVLQSAYLKGRAGPRQLKLDRLKVEAEPFSFILNGQLAPHGDYRHDLTLDWRYARAGAAALSGHGQLRGDLSRTQLTQTLSGPLAANMDAIVENALRDLHWRLNVNVADFNPAQANPAWPPMTASLSLRAQGNIATLSAQGKFSGDHAVSGPLNGDFQLRLHEDKVLEVERLTLQTPVGGRVEANGSWEPDNEAAPIQLTAHWENLGWPLQGMPQFTSERGALQLSGSPDSYQLGLAADFGGAGLPASFWRVSGGGSSSQLSLPRVQIDTLDGVSQGHAQIAWLPQLNWQAQLRGDHLNPATHWASWPGQLGFEIQSDGAVTDKGLHASVNLKEISGQLRGQPLRARSQIDIQGEELHLRQLNFRLGRAQFNARGSSDDIVQLHWQLQAPELAELLPDAQGNLNVKGSVHGPRLTPLITLDLNGQNLSYQNHRLQAIQTQARIDLKGQRDLYLNLTASGLEIGEWVMQQIETSVSGSGDDHHLRVSLVTPQTDLKLVVDGGLQDRNWQGQIKQLDLTDREKGTWHLEKTVGVNVLNFNSLQADTLCWISFPSRFCMQVDYATGNWKAGLQGKTLNLAWLQFLLPEGMQINGSADLDASGQWQIGKPPELTGNVKLDSGSVSVPLLDGERHHWDYLGGTLTLNVNASGAESQIQIAMLKGDRLDARVRLPDFDPTRLDLQSQPIEAKVELVFGNLELLEAFIPEMQNPRGNLKASFNVNGTVLQPRLEGGAELTNGSALISRLGIALTNLTIKAQSKNSDTLEFVASLRSGEGDVQIKGQTQLDAANRWPTTFTVKGENIQVANNPEARIQASPDLKINIRQREIRINGVVRVPIARIQPKDVTRAVTVSEDTVVIGRAEAQQEKWLIYTEVRLILGNRVTYEGSGFRGRVDGNILLRDKPGQLTSGTGELGVPEGRYEAYGQRLKVERGHILFTGSPLTNPGLDIRAVRTVGDVVAGIKVRGTVQSPQLELFSEPPMGQSDILSYIVLGRPLGESSREEGALVAQAALALSLKGGDILARSLGDRFGLEEMRIQAGETGDQASLVIGRYLSPRVYVSYGVGLLQAVNTASIRYEISRRWQFRAEAGEHQGGDFIYSIEKGD